MQITEITEPGQWSKVVRQVEGPQLVLAGPGTGKTEFLARRAAHLSQHHEDGAALILTFSRRAAVELENRVSGLLERPDSTLRAFTFHSFAYRLVESHCLGVGVQVPRLLTASQQVGVVAELLATEDPARWPAPFRPVLTTPAMAAEVADFVLRTTERMLGSPEVAARATQRVDWRALPDFIDRYQRHLGESGSVDYATVVAEAVELVESGTVDLPYRYVLVDEFQDVTPAQARLAGALAGPELALTVAADPHQSIYSFRGADLDSLLSLSDDVAARGHTLRVIELRRSFRVSSPVLAAARRLVASNPLPLPSPEVESSSPTGQVEGYTFDQRSAEAEWIADEVERLHLVEQVPLTSMAVMMRSTRRLLPELSRALDRRRIPHDRPHHRLFDHPAARIVADLVAAASGPDSPTAEAATRRLLGGRLVELTMGRHRQLQRLRERTGRSWPDLIRTEIPEAAALADLIENGSWAVRPDAPAGFWHMWERLPGLESIVADPDRADFRQAWADLSALLARHAESFPDASLVEVMEAIDTGDFEESPRLTYRPSGEDRLVVTTVHQAKGLEFDVVFIADAVEGSFPALHRGHRLLEPRLLTLRAVDHPSDPVAAALEEERRVAYTAVTRARRRVVWTATTAGLDQEGLRPSRFILIALDRSSFPAGPDAGADSPPLTRTALEAHLRRSLADPATPVPRRLAALTLLATASEWDASRFGGVPKRGPDRPLGQGQLRLSPTGADSYSRCPRRFALEKRLGASGGDSPYARFGEILHEVLERAETNAARTGRAHARLDEALTEMERTWPRYPPFGPPEFQEAWQRRGREFLERLYSAWPDDSDGIVALEHSFDIEFAGIRWQGRIDRVERSGGGIRIVDYKTTKSPPAKREVERSRQLALYLLAAESDPELAGRGPVVGAEMWFPLATRIRHPFDLDQLDTVREELAEIAAAVNEENWAPRPGSDCNRCDFRLICPAWPEGRLDIQ